MTGQTHHFQVGDYACIAICDKNDLRSIANLYTNLPAYRVAAVAQALGYDIESFPFPCTPLFIDTGRERVLIDVGRPQVEAGGDGYLLSGLRAEGIAPESIDVIMLTHGHGDHIGGLADADGQLFYPNVRTFMWKTEWDYWMNEATLAQLDAERAAARRASFGTIRDRVNLVESEAEIVPGIRYVPLFGHTPGHCGVLIESGGVQFLDMVDTLHTPLQMAHPEWYCRHDVEAKDAVNTREALLARLANENLLTLGFHLPYPGLGHVVSEGDEWRWQPIE
ncbi:MAG: MBL fold metallo-hydrolase [Anaerolineae bacterium]|nr:MBL fold metallo-hydrolase [Anaerolineae bacterium]